jgi:hypothetical protein
MVLRLCDVLDVPLRERNELLKAAGLVARYRARPFDAEDLAPCREALERLLAAHEPFPGLVLDRHWRVLLANAGATRLFGAVEGRSLVEWMATAGPQLVNGPAMAAIARERLRQQLYENPADEELARLVAVAEASSGEVPPPSGQVVICPTFLVDGREVTVVGLAARFETPVDVTVAELRLELLFPADQRSAAFFG